MIRRAGELAIPFTSGILIGIGETPAERVEALLALRDLHDEHGHIQEVIVQNFRAKPDTADGGRRRAGAGRADERLRDRAPGDGAGDEHPGARPTCRPTTARCCWRASTTGAGSPPSPPTSSTPRRPGPTSTGSSALCADAGYALRERLTIYPEYLADDRFLDPGLREPRAGHGRRRTGSRASSRPPRSPASGRVSVTFCRVGRAAGGRRRGPPTVEAGAGLDEAAVAAALERGPAAGRDRAPPTGRRSPGWSTPPMRWRWTAAGWPGWRITVRHGGPAGDGARRARAQPARPSCARTPAGLEEAHRARLAAGDGTRACRSRWTLGRGRPSTRSPPARSTWWSATGARRGRRRCATRSPRGRSSSAPPCRPRPRSTTPAPTCARPLFTAWLRPGRRLGGGAAALHLGPRARRGAAGAGAAPVGRVGGRGLARGRARGRPRAASHPDLAGILERSLEGTPAAGRRDRARSSAARGPEVEAVAQVADSCAAGAAATRSPTS